MWFAICYLNKEIEMKEEKIFSVRSMVFMAIFAAIMCICGPISIPLPGLVPISLGTFVIYLAGAVLGKKRAAVAVGLYILLGLVGLPVFTLGRGGFSALIGVTGGYIVGFIPMVLIIGIFADMKTSSHWAMIPGMALGTAVMYTSATMWYMVITGSALIPALMSCVVPFLIGDSIKIMCATALAMPLKSRLNAIMYNRKEG